MIHFDTKGIKIDGGPFFLSCIGVNAFFNNMFINTSILSADEIFENLTFYRNNKSVVIT